MKRKGEKERYKYLKVEFQRIARRDKKAFLSNQCKEIEENNRMGKTRDSSRKLEIPREHFMQRWAQYRTEMEWYPYFLSVGWVHRIYLICMYELDIY